MKYFPLLLSALLVTLSSCDSTPASGDKKPAAPLHTVTGKIRFDDSLTVPADARVLAVWEGSRDSTTRWTLHGEGKVDMRDSSFRLVFDAPPPASALHEGGLGVAYLFLIGNAALTAGPLDSNEIELIDTATIGLAEDYGLVYVRTTSDSVKGTLPWTAPFQKGFNNARGVRIPEPSLERDQFAPAGSETMIIVIDEARKLQRIRWQ